MRPPTWDYPRKESWVLEFLNTANEWSTLSPTLEFADIVEHYAKHYSERSYAATVSFRFRNLDTQELIPVDIIQG